MAAGVTRVILSGEHLMSNFRHGSVSVGLEFPQLISSSGFPDVRFLIAGRAINCDVFQAVDVVLSHGFNPWYASSFFQVSSHVVFHLSHSQVTNLLK